jgi:hypothetical protein
MGGSATERESSSGEAGVGMVERLTSHTYRRSGKVEDGRMRCESGARGVCVCVCVRACALRALRVCQCVSVRARLLVAGHVSVVEGHLIEAWTEPLCYVTEDRRVVGEHTREHCLGVRLRT